MLQIRPAKFSIFRHLRLSGVPPKHCQLSTKAVKCSTSYIRAAGFANERRFKSNLRNFRCFIARHCQAFSEASSLSSVGAKCSKSLIRATNDAFHEPHEVAHYSLPQHHQEPSKPSKVVKNGGRVLDIPYHSSKRCFKPDLRSSALLMVWWYQEFSLRYQATFRSECHLTDNRNRSCRYCQRRKLQVRPAKSQAFHGLTVSGFLRSIEPFFAVDIIFSTT
jgi:hypothetical protein